MAELTKNMQEKIISNASTLLARSMLSGQLGKSFKGKRDIYEIFGYKKEISIDDYYNKYDRQDIAGRIVDAPAKETWRQPPTVTDDSDAEEETEMTAKKVKTINDLIVGGASMIVDVEELAKQMDLPINEGGIDEEELDEEDEEVQNQFEQEYTD